MEEKNTVPPYTNRGAQNTKQSGLRACLDWVAVTFHGVFNPYEIVTLLGFKNDDFEAKENGKFGYPYHLRNGHICIYYSAHLDHIHLEISGQGCREYEGKNLYDWSTLFGLFLMMKKIKFTRLDLAIDDFDGYFKVRSLYQKHLKGHARSKFKEWKYFTKGKISDGAFTGHTLYLGNPTSRLLIRFYDKLLERQSRGKEIEEGIEFWNRTEIQMRDERAMSAAVMIANESYKIGHLVSGVLKNYINYIKPKKLKSGLIDENKGRWDVCEFWDRFLGDVEPIKLTLVAPDRTIETTRNWFEKQITPSLALLLEAFDNDTELIYNWVKEGNERLSDRHKDMLKRYKNEQNKIMNIKKEQTIENDLLNLIN